MEQLALQSSISHSYPKQMKAMVRDARDPNHVHGGGHFTIAGADGFGFDDVIDAVNPLQHIPGVSSLYQEATNDTMSPIISIASGALLGGPIGAALSAANVIFESASGDSVLGHVLSLFEEGSGNTATTGQAIQAYLRHDLPILPSG